VLDLRSVGLLLDELLLCDPDAVLNHLSLAEGLGEIVGVQGVRVVGTRASRGEKSRIAREHREHCVIRCGSSNMNPGELNLGMGSQAQIQDVFQAQSEREMPLFKIVPVRWSSSAHGGLP